MVQFLSINIFSWISSIFVGFFKSYRRILQSMQHTQGDTKKRELLKCVVALKECIRGGGRHLQDVIFKH